MSAWNRASALTFQEQERTVIRDFWTALKQFAGRLPFVEDLVAAYYCALDPATPMRVRGILLAALAYFIFRWRYRPLTMRWGIARRRTFDQHGKQGDGSLGPRSVECPVA